jgi:hypothetical protein
MRVKCLGCEALARVIYLCAAHSPHIVDVELFRLGLHSEPAELRALLQSRIDAATGEGYEALLLAYGLCGQTTAGLTARDIPVVIPRAHDCITLFLGDRARYKDQFDNYPGTYWYVQDYVERNDSAGTALSLGAGTETDIREVYDEYVEKYGVDNANYLMEVMGAWHDHYQRAAFIDMGIGDGSATEAKTREEAARRGWTFEHIAGDLILIRRLLAGDWEDDFVVLEPGQQIAMTYDDDIMDCRPLAQTEFGTRASD